MAVYEGRLTEIAEKHGKAKVSGKPWTMYSLVVNDDNGTHYLGTAFDKPKAPVGAIIRVEAEENNSGYLDADVSTLEVLKGEEAKSVSAPSQQQALSAVNRKERSIVTQTAYKIAVLAVNGMLENGTITAKAATKAKEKGAFGLYIDYLDKVAEHVFNKCITPFEETSDNNNNEEEDGEDGEYDPTA